MVDETIAQHLTTLHTYNEIRDLALGVAEKLAQFRNCPINEVLEAYSVDVDA